MIPRPDNRYNRLYLRWQQVDPRLRIAVQSLAAAGLVVLIFGALRAPVRGVNETAASILVAVVFGAATVLQTRQTQRRQHSVELIMSFQTTDALVAADVWMADRIESGEPVGPALPADEQRHVVTMLDYYEFLSSLALRGYVDVRMLLGLRGGAMSRCYECCREYIDHRREHVGDELYRSVQVLVREHGDQAERRAR
jgi:hypothetical protein